MVTEWPCGERYKDAKSPPRELKEDGCVEAALQKAGAMKAMRQASIHGNDSTAMMHDLRYFYAKRF